MRVCSFDNVEKAVFVAFANLTENCTILQVLVIHILAYLYKVETNAMALLPLNLVD